VVAPATGSFGGAAVAVALGMGARVIAAGRNEVQLKKMSELFNKSYGGRLSYVKLTGDVEADAQSIQKASPNSKGVDCYIDFSPPEAAKSQHLKSCLMALKTHGRAAFMGGIQSDISIPYSLLMIKSLQIKGKFMYERHQVIRLIGMVEAGLIKLGAEAGVEVVSVHKLEDFEAALDAAEKNSGFGKEVVFEP
jgi:threonine dehydrogenase-like Zn-dependent dehydrogenase